MLSVIAVSPWMITTYNQNILIERTHKVHDQVCTLMLQFRVLTHKITLHPHVPQTDPSAGSTYGLLCIQFHYTIVTTIKLSQYLFEEKNEHGTVKNYCLQKSLYIYT